MTGNLFITFGKPVTQPGESSYHYGFEDQYMSNIKKSLKMNYGVLKLPEAFFRTTQQSVYDHRFEYVDMTT
jgi:hypothetical protein